MNAYFGASFTDFCDASPEAVLGELLENSQFSVEGTQRDAWVAQIAILKSCLRERRGHLFFEFVVPRIGSRIDVVLVLPAVLVLLEFKVGADTYNRVDFEQVWDYALDLKNFHLASHSLPIVPVLVATEGAPRAARLPIPYPDRVYPPLQCNGGDLADLISELDELPRSEEAIDPIAWGNSPYRPTPTIIQAARALYAQHSVDAIARNDAGTTNLGVTTECVEAVVEEAVRLGQKAIVFITGVPGAGKTLVGLNIATRRREDGTTHAVFLSGNGPLVQVLREALTGR